MFEKKFSDFKESLEDAIKREAERAGVQIENIYSKYDEKNITYAKAELKPSRFNNLNLEVECDNNKNVCKAFLVVRTTPTLRKEVQKWAFGKYIYTPIYSTRGFLGAEEEVVLDPKREIAIEIPTVSKDEIINKIREVLGSFVETFERKSTKSRTLF
jgi:hypothetical protein